MARKLSRTSPAPLRASGAAVHISKLKTECSEDVEATRVTKVGGRDALQLELLRVEFRRIPHIDQIAQSLQAAQARAVDAGRVNNVAAFGALAVGVEQLSPAEQSLYTDLAVYPEDVWVPVRVIVRFSLSRTAEDTGEGGEKESRKEREREMARTRAKRLGEREEGGEGEEQGEEQGENRERKRDGKRDEREGEGEGKHGEAETDSDEEGTGEGEERRRAREKEGQRALDSQENLEKVILGSGEEKG